MNKKNQETALSLLAEATDLFKANPTTGASAALSAAMRYYQEVCKGSSLDRYRLCHLLDDATCKIVAARTWVSG